jgi:hypothetical protein
LQIRKIFLLVLTLVVSSARAEWVKLGETDEGSLYIEADSVLRDRHFRQVIELIDLKQRDEDGELSRRTRVEYDCALGRTKVLSISTHGEAMATGKALVAVNREGLWKDVPPGTAYEEGFRMVCAK